MCEKEFRALQIRRPRFRYTRHLKMPKCKNAKLSLCAFILVTSDVSKTKRNNPTKCCRIHKIQQLTERGWVVNPSSVRTQMCKNGIWPQSAAIIPHVAFSISNPCDRRAQMSTSGSKCEIRMFHAKAGFHRRTQRLGPIPDGRLLCRRIWDNTPWVNGRRIHWRH